MWQITTKAAYLHILLYEPEILLLEIYPTEMCTYVHQKYAQNVLRHIIHYRPKLDIIQMFIDNKMT